MGKEILTSRLGTRQPGDESTVGWVPGMSAEEAWEAGRHWWRVKPTRAIECDLMLVLDPEGRVIAEAQVEGLRKHRNYAETKRCEILGDLVREPEYLGRVVRRNTSQNPIAYITSEDIA